VNWRPGGNVELGALRRERQCQIAVGRASVTFNAVHLTLWARADQQPEVGYSRGVRFGVVCHRDVVFVQSCVEEAALLLRHLCELVVPIPVRLKSRTRELSPLRTWNYRSYSIQGLENDASARPPNLSSSDLDLWLTLNRFDRVMDYLCIKISSFSKCCVHMFCKRRINGRTDRSVENIMQPPASLDWRRNTIIVVIAVFIIKDNTRLARPKTRNSIKRCAVLYAEAEPRAFMYINVKKTFLDTPLAHTTADFGLKSYFLVSYCPNQSCIPNLKLLASTVTKISRGSQHFLDAYPSPDPRRFWS